MSFTWLADKPLRTREEIAREVHQVSLSRNLDELASVICLMAISVEVGANDRNGNRQWWCPANKRVPATLSFPHDSTSDDNRSSGYLQQQPGPNGEPWWGTPQDMMTLSRAANTFLERLADDYGRAKDNPSLAGQFAQRVQGSAFPDRYATRWGEAWEVLNRALSGPPSASPSWFTEHNLLSSFGNSSSRNGSRPRLIVLHTSEGAGGMNLVNYMRGAQVSYHNVIDNNGDVFALVDTDRTSWSVLNANPYTINYCFGASRAAWTRNEWLRNHENGIKIAAYLAAVDCKKYNIPPVVRVGNSASGYPSLPSQDGITDHYGITVGLKIGNHTDVGPHFPWDVFNQHLQKFYGTTGQDDFLMALSDAEQKELLEKTRFVYSELSKKFPSRSIYRNPGEGLVDTLAGMTLNVDGMTHADLVEDAACRGDKDSIMRIVRTAAGEGAVKDQWAIDRAKAALAEVPPEYLAAYEESK